MAKRDVATSSPHTLLRTLRLDSVSIARRDTVLLYAGERMPYLMFKHEGSAELDAQYRKALGLYALGVQRAAEYLLRALQLMAPRIGVTATESCFR